MSIYGIDFGCSKACIAVKGKDGIPIIVQNYADGTHTLDCAVYFENDNSVIVGAVAKDMAEVEGERVIQCIKQELGQSGDRTYEFDGKTYSPIEIAAFIFIRLKQIVEEQGNIMSDVVISCPSYFGLSERNAVKQAGELAGLNVLGLINEPTAAAIYYCQHHFESEKNILVYDLGCGSFDFSVIKTGLHTNGVGNNTSQLSVLTTGGNNQLGGKAWDARLYEYILSVYCEKNGLMIDDIDYDTRQLIYCRLEAIKKRLSTSETAKIKIAANGEITIITVSKKDFETLTFDLATETINFLEKSLQEAGNIDINTVLLIGGSTYIPTIYQLMVEKFPGKVQVFEPAFAVAKGAAIYGQHLCR